LTETLLFAVTVLLSGCSVALDFDSLSSSPSTTEFDGGDDGGDGATESSGSLALPIDCAAAENVKHPKCVPPRHQSAGSVGAGIVLPFGSTGLGVASGFLGDEALVLAVDGPQDEGGILRIDLASGDRTLVSGFLTDLAYERRERGSGPSLAHTWDVAPLSDGSWIAAKHVLPRSLVRIDPATGDRSQELSWSSLACGQGPLGDLRPLAGTMPHLEVDSADGLLWLVQNPSGTAAGLVRWKGGSCRVVAYHEQESSEFDVGEGPRALGNVRDMRVLGDSLWILSGHVPGVVRLDLETGNRTVVSRSDSPQIGAGSAKIGVHSLAPAPDRIWTVGPLISSLFALTRVNPTSGDREGHRPTFGPILDSYVSSSQVWLEPLSPLVVMEVDDAILLFDPATDNSNVLSF
jgi:hypothetical protein